MRALKILVVEDDAVYAEFVATTLRAAGHDITVATTGLEARTLARAVDPEAVILDLTLPDETGYEVSRALRGGLVAASTVIILLTANLFPEHDVAKAVGIDVVLSKPVQPELVSGMVELVWQRRRKL